MYVCMYLHDIRYDILITLRIGHPICNGVILLGGTRSHKSSEGIRVC